MSVSTDLVSDSDVATVRRKTNEPTSAVYDDDALKTIIVEYAYTDVFGTNPQFIETGATATTPPVLADTEWWLPTFDLNAAASQIWEEKAGQPADDFKFGADNGSYDRNQVYEQYMAQARFFGARRIAKTINVRI